jgi:hypothetical protein
VFAFNSEFRLSAALNAALRIVLDWRIASVFFSFPLFFSPIPVIIF